MVKAAQGPTLMEPGALLQTVQRCVQEHRAHRRRAGGRATPLAHPHHQAPAPPAAAQQLLEAQQVRGRRGRRRDGGAALGLPAHLLSKAQACVLPCVLPSRRAAAPHRPHAGGGRPRAPAAVSAPLGRPADGQLCFAFPFTSKPWAPTCTHRDDRAAAVVARRQASRASLPPEPAASAGVALVRVRLPDGSTAQRTFVADTDLRALFGFVDSLDAVECWNYRLVRRLRGGAVGARGVACARDLLRVPSFAPVCTSR